MLNIPDSIKALYKRDGVRKNFRAHFPGGELPDITNDNIVQESVQFTESVCSQDVLKFGLAEASVIEFETVGVGNMYGMVIECANEIDCSSLSAADIDEIEEGDFDGEYVAAAGSDIGFPFYRVPYGVFIVEACTRDHQAMTHRRVQGYSLIGGEATLNPFEVQKCRAMFWTKQYTPNTKALMLEQVGYRNDAVLTGLGYTKSAVELSFTPRSADELKAWTSTLNVKKSDGTSATVLFWVYSKLSHNSSHGQPQIDLKTSLFSAQYPEYDYAAMFATIEEFLDENEISASMSGYGSLREIADEGLNNYYRPGVLYQHSEKTDDWSYLVNVPIMTNNMSIYPYMDKAGCQMRSPFSITVWLNYPDGDYVHIENIPDCTFYSYTKDDQTPFALLEHQFENTLKTRVNGKMRYSFSNVFSAEDIVVSPVELLAAFFSADRYGAGKMTRLSHDDPIVIIPGEYRRMWWDEFDVDPVGTIRYAYVDKANEEQIEDYTFGPGQSVYDMTDNFTLKTMPKANRSNIEALLSQDFIPNLGGLDFTPIDMDMKGLPYLEAGDPISVTAQDGTVCESYILTQTISGVQSLEASIQSESGFVIGSEEDEE